MTDDSHIHQSFSFWQIAWKRLKKNKSAVIGSVIIILAVIMGIFAYYIAPDSSGLALSAYKAQGFRFPGHRPSELAAAIGRAIEELTRR